MPALPTATDNEARGVTDTASAGRQAEARMAIFQWIEGWNHPYRRHSALCPRYTTSRSAWLKPGEMHVRLRPGNRGPSTAVVRLRHGVGGVTMNNTTGRSPSGSRPEHDLTGFGPPGVPPGGAIAGCTGFLRRVSTVLVLTCLALGAAADARADDFYGSPGDDGGKTLWAWDDVMQLWNTRVGSEIFYGFSDVGEHRFGKLFNRHHKPSSHFSRTLAKEYRVEAVKLVRYGTNHGNLMLTLDATLAAGDKDRLVFHVCGDQFTLSEATENATTHVQATR